jgi:hypothetical protein
MGKGPTKASRPIGDNAGLIFVEVVAPAVIFFVMQAMQFSFL